MISGVPEAAVVKACREIGESDTEFVRAILEAGAPVIARSIITEVAVDFRATANAVGLDADISGQMVDIILKYAERYGAAG